MFSLRTAVWLDVSVVKSWPVSEREQKEKDRLFFIYMHTYINICIMCVYSCMCKYTYKCISIHTASKVSDSVSPVYFE